MKWWKANLVDDLGAVFFAGLGFVFLGLFLLMVYEVVALTTHWVPSISFRAATAIGLHPHVALVIAALLGVAFGALAAHFGRWTIKG